MEEPAVDEPFLLRLRWTMHATRSMTANISSTPAMAIPIANLRTETQKSSSERAGSEDGASPRKKKFFKNFPRNSLLLENIKSNFKEYIHFGCWLVQDYIFLGDKCSIYRTWHKALITETSGSSSRDLIRRY